jgi:hypothetical protein
MAKMDDGQLTAICEAKLNTALGWMGGLLSKERQLAMQYYRGDAFGNEQDGRSKVVSRDVAEAIDSVMPGLIKVFASTDTIIVAQPRKPSDEAVAQQATDYLNWIFQSQPNAFDMLQTWIKDGLLSKLGVVKSWWDDSRDVVTETYEGLTRFQYLTLVSNADVEPVRLTARPAGPGPIDPTLPQPLSLQGAGASGGLAAALAGQPSALMDDGHVYACTIRRTTSRGRICIQAIPPEEFLTDRRAVSLEEATFCAHRTRCTVSDLIAMGYDKSVVMSLSGDNELDFNAEVLTRFAAEDEEPQRDADSLDDSMRHVWVAECYLKVDYDGDGLAEWRKVTLAGGGGYEILDHEECDGHPFSAWTPNKMPHKLYGESLADKTMDLQLIKSTVWRQTLDGMYFNNAPQLVVMEGQANMEDVLTRRPGGVIRARSPGAVTPLPVQDVSGPGMAMINYLDSVREARTGVRRFSAGLEADALNPYNGTATGAQLVDDASQDRVMLLARNFAEQGLKPLFNRLLELSIKYQDKPTVMRLRGKWVDIDPSTWTTKMDMTVAVGLGTGNRDRQVGQLITMLTQIDAQLVQAQGGLKGPLLTAANVYNKLSKLTESMGYRDGGSFYTDPSTIPPAPPAPPLPDANAALAQAQLQLAQQQAALQMQQRRDSAQLDAAIAQEKARQQGTIAALKAQADLATEQRQVQVQAQLDQQRAAHQAQLDTMKAQHEIALQKMRALADIEIAQTKVARSAAVRTVRRPVSDTDGVQ